MKLELKLGNSLEVLKEYPDNHFDSVVTDPPYGLSFMGKKWDYDVPSVEIWKEVLRVLKPGGHLVSFSSSRTYHRMTVNVEDAGFEVRDQLMWLYGSGFPKSHNIGKAIDKKPRSTEAIVFKKWLAIQIDACSKTKAQINKECGFTACSYTKIDGKDYWTSALPKDGKWDIMKKVIDITVADFDWVQEDNTEARGFVEPTGGLHNGREDHIAFKGKQLSNNSVDANAKKYEGWGTALKPAHEPIVLARKPLSEKTIVDNVIKWGTGGINIDGSRVEHTEDLSKVGDNHKALNQGVGFGFKDVGRGNEGRFPANIIHDGSPEVLEGFPTVQKSTNYTRKKKRDWSAYANEDPTIHNIEPKLLTGGRWEPAGSAARFFYCAKVSKKERNAGLDEFATQEVDKYIGTAEFGRRKCASCSTWEPDCICANNDYKMQGHKPNKNNHPTVKPVALMAYLCKLITPTNGTILDPFMGSGSTGMAAKQEGFSFTGIDLDEAYVEIAQARIDAWKR